MAKVTFNAKDLTELDGDLSDSKRAVPIIFQRVLSSQFRKLTTRLRPQVHGGPTGDLRKSFKSSVRRNRSGILASLGFFSGKGISKSAAIAGNVQQKPGAFPKKGKYLWIPIAGNRAADGSAFTSPRQLIDEGGFIKMTKAGNRVAFARGGGNRAIPRFVLKTFVRFPSPPVQHHEVVVQSLPEIQSEITRTIADVIAVRKKAIEVVRAG